MSLVCALFLWAILAAIGFSVAAVGAVVLLASIARRSKLGTIAGGLLGAAGSVVAVGALLFIGGWLLWGIWPHETTSRRAFDDAFGFPAGPEVTQIRSRTMSSTDSHEQFLRFHAPPQTIATIVRTRFKRIPTQQCAQEWRQWKDDAPDWWSATPAPQAECYTADPYDQLLMSNAAWLLYDPSSREAYFHYSGVE